MPKAIRKWLNSEKYFRGLEKLYTCGNSGELRTFSLKKALRIEREKLIF